MRDAHGEVVGVLDASSYFESRQRHTQALVQMAATHIENGLLLHQMRGQLVLAMHPRAEFLGTLSAGLLAFDDEGRLAGVQRAAPATCCSGLEVSRGTAFEELFGEPFELFAGASCSGGGEQRLRDALGSALVATCVQLPPRLQPAGERPGRRMKAAPPGRRGASRSSRRARRPRPCAATRSRPSSLPTTPACAPRWTPWPLRCGCARRS